MGLLDFFGQKAGSVKGLEKHAQRVANRRAQSPDRWTSIQALAAMKDERAITALLTRFTYYIEPGSVDHEEKELVFSAIVNNAEVAVKPVVDNLAQAESISWALKILDQILPAETVVEHLLAVLAQMGTEYERDPQRKIQILATLAERKDKRISHAVSRFLADTNEAVRFHAVETVLAQEDAAQYKPQLNDHAAKEESLRIRNLIAKL